MKQFKKRTLALVLASVVTVVGAFGAENYKNSLTGLTFENGANGIVNMVVQTKRGYDGNVTPVRRSTNTYVLMLPEMNSIASTPDLKSVSNNIANVEIKTMPYSNTAKGYTRITIETTNPQMNISATNQVLLSPVSSEQSAPESMSQKSYERDNRVKSREEELRQRELRIQKKNAEMEALAKAEAKKKEEVSPSAGLVSVDNGAGLVAVEPLPVSQEYTLDYANEETHKNYLLLLSILIVLASAFFYIKAKDKMVEVAGEKLDIDITTDEKKSKRKNLRTIKNTINKLDSAYARTSTSVKNEYILPAKPINTKKPSEELEIVDLDELFQEQKAKVTTKEEDENAALEEFLSGFSFDEDVEIEEQQEVEQGYDESFYEETIRNDKMTFDKDDIVRINKLLGTEINDDTLKNIEKYAVSNPIKKVPTKREILEDFVTTYAISQNITFKSEDIRALYKLISVEIDSDFINDLRTNPERTKEMQKDILSYGDKPKKASEIVTMTVKDMLPDLSEALRKQGGRRVESKYKAETVYYSEGYDVSKLSVSENMPDLSVEINKKEAFVSKPSAKAEIVDTNYMVGDGTLKTNNVLPDLQDVLAHPEKYEEPEPEEVIVDEEALLRNISNVQFKPFYDGTEEFEVLNHFDDVPTVPDIQQEFNQFGNFEITEEEPLRDSPLQDDYDDFKALYSNEFVDLDKEIATKKDIKEEKKEEFVPIKLERKVEIRKREDRPKSEELLQKIEETRIERERRKAAIISKKEEEKNNNSKDSQSVGAGTVCLVAGESYNVVSSVELQSGKGCHLAKNDKGYVVLGYLGDKLFKLKEYKSLKSEKIQARLNEKLQDGSLRYIVRIGLKKFMVVLKEDNIEYMMDLC